MPQFQRKPSVVEAVQFSPTGDWQYQHVCFGYPHDGDEAHPLDAKHWIPTPDVHGQPVVLSDGDWIVTDAFGKREVHTAEAFAANFTSQEKASTEDHPLATAD